VSPLRANSSAVAMLLSCAVAAPLLAGCGLGIPLGGGLPTGATSSTSSASAPPPLEPEPAPVEPPAPAAPAVPPVTAPPDAAAEICATARLAFASPTVDDAEDEIFAIRQRNLERAESDALFWQVWQLADAWDGYAALRDTPELTDGAVVVRAALENLLAECEALAY